MWFYAILVGVLAALAIAAPTRPHVIHEERSKPSANWIRTSKLSSDLTLPIRIGLSQRNLEHGYEFLMEVSHPSSPQFGQYWSAKKVAETFAPSQNDIETVKGWLAGAGISPERVSLSRSAGWLKFDASVEEAEELLKTEYHLYEHAGGTKQVACEAYSIPEGLPIDFITPTVHFDARVTAGGDKLRRRDVSKPAFSPTVVSGNATGIGSPSTGSLPKLRTTDLNISALISGTSQCDKYITAECLRALYDLPLASTANSANSYAVVEFKPDAYLQDDLNMFFANFSPSLAGAEPIVNLIDGAIIQINKSDDTNGESNLDLEYAMALVNPLNVTLYQVGNTLDDSFNNFLDALDADYCTFDGGDDPNFDHTYPDPYGGYQVKDCGTIAPAYVISISWGCNEKEVSAAYAQRQCNEYMKLGLLGVTVLFSSGDDGVAGNNGVCIGPDGNFNNGTSGRFAPAFPNGCPYLTSVGATQVNPGATVDDPESASSIVFYSGGGFSDVFDMPDYQASAVADYYANYAPSYTSEQYNNSRTSRGHPDVAANGVNYVYALYGEFILVYGTSASSPVFGSVVALINDARLNAGKSTVGFMNPTLYENPSVLNDITNGTNPGCGTNGFTAVPGWDPVTGLGTPNYPAMLDLYLSLP